MPYKPSAGRPAADIAAEFQARQDALPAIARCLHCPDWSHEGTAAECRAASASHRARYHSDTRVRKRRRGTVSRFSLGAESDRVAGEQNAAAVAVMLARRSAGEAA